MILESLQVIGEVIANRDFAGNEYAKYYTASDVSGDNKVINSVVVIRLQRENNGLSYDGVKIIDPESSPEKTALKHGYSLSSNVTDNSLTKRATGTSTSTLMKRLPKMLDSWFDPSVLDDHIDHPFIQSVKECVGPGGKARSQIEADIEDIEDRVEYRALVTISITDENGKEQFAGEIEAFNEGLRRWVMDDMRSKSTAKSCFGETRCTVCDDIVQCFGLGATLNEMYTFKKQWPFPKYNSSNAWQSRPLCIECLMTNRDRGRPFYQRTRLRSTGCSLSGYSVYPIYRRGWGTIARNYPELSASASRCWNRTRARAADFCRMGSLSRSCRTRFARRRTSARIRLLRERQCKNTRCRVD